MRLHRALCLAFLLGASGAPAKAADWYTGAPAVGVAAPRNNFGVAVDMAVTADTLDSVYGTVIGTIAPFTGLDQTGMRLRIGGVAGTYAYNTTNLGRVTGTQEEGSFMVGYEWVARRLSLAGYIGGDINNNRTSVYDANNKSVGTAYGVKVAVDFNWRPNDAMMLSGVAAYSTAHNSYYTRFKFGYAVVPGIYFGPEALFLGDNFFTQWRVGGHITGATFGPLQFGISGGMLNDRVRGTGAYGILDARATF